MVDSICLLGSTGSIGTQTLDVVRKHHIRVDALAAGSRVKEIEQQCREFHPHTVYIGEKNYHDLKTSLADTDISVVTGEEQLSELASATSASCVVNALTGILGLRPTVAAIQAGKDIALANKETMVAGGDLVNQLADEHHVRILPVDSEHSAIFQCLQGQKSLKKILLTGSGGPFFGKKREELESIRPEDALRHPNWSMGPKITVDSSTLMNKGLELIEAVHLFRVRPEQIEVVIQRESVIHSMVEFEDNAILAQMGVPDMRLCIQYALTYPERTESPCAELDLFSIQKLSFYRPDTDTFPLLRLARTAIQKRGTVPAAMNGANEEAVWKFLRGEIKYLDIEKLVIRATEAAATIEQPSLEQILDADKAAREYVNRL